MAILYYRRRLCRGSADSAECTRNEVNFDILEQEQHIDVCPLVCTFHLRLAGFTGPRFRIGGDIQIFGGQKSEPDVAVDPMVIRCAAGWGSEYCLCPVFSHGVEENCCAGTTRGTTVYGIS